MTRRTPCHLATGFTNRKLHKKGVLRPNRQDKSERLCSLVPAREENLHGFPRRRRQGEGEGGLEFLKGGFVR